MLCFLCRHHKHYNVTRFSQESGYTCQVGTASAGTAPNMQLFDTAYKHNIRQGDTFDEQFLKKNEEINLAHLYSLHCDCLWHEKYLASLE